MPTRRGNSLAFTVTVAVAMLLGAGLMSFVLLRFEAPTALVVGVVLAALPVGPLIASLLWLDRYEPEPRWLLALGLGWGALVATSAALVLQAADAAVFGRPLSMSAALVAPITEEAAKGLFVVLLLVARRRDLDGILDGIVYAGMVGIGFAFTENILYLAGAYVGGPGMGPGGIEATVGTFIVRGIFSPFAHPLFTAMTGIGVGIAVRARSRGVRFGAPLLGYVAAVIAHALWNWSVFMNGGSGFVGTYVLVMVPAFLSMVGFAVWIRSREGRMLARALTDCAHRGLLDPAEVPWLVRIPARRACRRAALARGGRSAVTTTREYQQQAIELGFLHSRLLRGTAPQDAVPRGQAMVDRMHQLRPGVVFPQPSSSAVVAR